MHRLPRLTIALLTTAALALFSLGAFAQTEAGRAAINPILLNLTQSVPITLTLTLPAHAEPGQPITLPMTLDLNLNLSLSSPYSATVDLDTTTEPVVTRPMPTPSAPASPSVGGYIAAAEPVAVEAHGLTITVERAELHNAEEVVDFISGFELSMYRNSDVADNPSLGFMDIAIVNQSDSPLSAGGFDSVVIVNGEQNSLTDYFIFSDSVIGDSVQPGATIDGRIYFGASRTSWSELSRGAVVELFLENIRGEDFMPVNTDPVILTLDLEPTD